VKGQGGGGVSTAAVRVNPTKYPFFARLSSANQYILCNHPHWLGTPSPPFTAHTIAQYICSADGSTHTESNKLYRKVKHRYRPNLSPRQRPTAKVRHDQAVLAASAEARGATHRARPRSLSLNTFHTHTAASMKRDRRKSLLCTPDPPLLQYKPCNIGYGNIV